MTEWDQMGIPVKSTSQKTHLDMVVQGNYVYFADDIFVKLLQQESCDFKTLQNYNPTFPIGFGFQNNSAYVKHTSKM